MVTTRSPAAPRLTMGQLTTAFWTDCAAGDVVAASAAPAVTPAVMATIIPAPRKPADTRRMAFRMNYPPQVRFC
jgi:hypothetical protein